MVRRQNYQRRNNYQANENQASSAQAGANLENTQAASRDRQQGVPGAGQHSSQLAGSTSTQPVNRSGGQERSYLQRQRYSQENIHNREMSQPRENAYSRGYQRDSGSKYHGHSSQGNISRAGERVKSEETVEDIKADILRLEKEIELEIKEIRSLKLGL